MTIKLFKDQNYSSIKKSCARKDKLFVDKTFPANYESIFKSKRLDVEWKRPHVISIKKQNNYVHINLNYI